MADLFAIMYVSAAVTPFQEAELEALLVQAREFNRQHEISGLLLYRDGNFMQLIEGPKEHVESLYSRILADPRHHMIITLLQEPVSDRLFSGWAMAYKPLTEPDWRELMEEIRRGEGAGPLDSHKLLKVLLSFWQRG